MKSKSNRGLTQFESLHASESWHGSWDTSTPIDATVSARLAKMNMRDERLDGMGKHQRFEPGGKGGEVGVGIVAYLGILFELVVACSL